MDIQTVREKQSTFVTLPSPWPSPDSCAPLETYCKRWLDVIHTSLHVRDVANMVMDYVADWKQGEAYVPWLRDVTSYACFYSSKVDVRGALQTSYYRFGFRIKQEDGTLTCWVRHCLLRHDRGWTVRPPSTLFQLFENQPESSVDVSDQEDNYDHAIDDVVVVHPCRTVLITWQGGTFEHMVGSLVFDASGQLQHLMVDRKQQLLRSNWPDDKLPMIPPRCGHPLSRMPFFARYAYPLFQTVEDVNKHAKHARATLTDYDCDECMSWSTETRPYMTLDNALRQFASDSIGFITFTNSFL